MTDPNTKIGSIVIRSNDPSNKIFIDNSKCTGNIHANIRMMQGPSAIIINSTLGRYAAFHDIFLRSRNQVLFWGKGSSTVGCSIEIEGDGHGVIIGDDALFSSGIWIRNHHMHSIVDLSTKQVVSAYGVNTIVERHVWLGQDVLLLKCPRIGKGSIVGAASLVNKALPAMVSAAGTPARVLRENLSWGRSPTGMNETELAMLGL